MRSRSVRAASHVAVTSASYIGWVSAMGGAKYLKGLKAPLPQVEMIPTGGVSLATAREFLEAGAFALGVGADLVDPKMIAKGTPEVITENAAKYLAIVREFRESRAGA